MFDKDQEKAGLNSAACAVAKADVIMADLREAKAADIVEAGGCVLGSGAGLLTTASPPGAIAGCIGGGLVGRAIIRGIGFFIDPGRKFRERAREICGDDS